MRRIVLLGCIAVSGCMIGRSVRPQPAAVAPFILTFWCGPPLDVFNDARAAEIAAAGFNIVGPPCEGGVDRERNLRALDVAARHGLRLWLADPRYDLDAVSQPDWNTSLARAVADYAAHPAFGGYFVTDEPTADDFDRLARLVDALRRNDPEHVAYVNLMPDYVPAPWLRTDSYGAYLDRFITTVRPPLLSYDYYPFGTSRDRSTFFDNLTRVSGAARRANVPFMLIVQVMPHANYREVTAAELAWQAFHALAFGARGVSYFAYWTPPPGQLQFHHGIIDHGAATGHYAEVARLNVLLNAYAAELAQTEFLGAVDPAGQIGGPLPIGPLTSVDGGPVTIGVFVGSHDCVYTLLVNRDYHTAITARLQLRPEARTPSIFDPTARGWSKTDASVVQLAAGGAALLRWPATDTCSQ